MVNPDDYNYINTKEKTPAIGYISRMCEENGLEVLIDAFILLKKDSSFKDTMLVITGGKTGDDDKFLRRIRKKIADASVQQYIEFHKDFEEDGRRDFFNKVSMVSVPVLEGEAFGLYILESITSGVPVVQPALGAFPEIIELAGGGITYQPNSPKELANSLAILLNDPEKLSELSRAGRKGIIEHFDLQDQTLKMVNLYKNISNQKKADTDVI
jgi:glycosyltransferase involved in cell wall biosynthesis